MSAYSLWGEINHVWNICRGVRTISTPGHGGIVIAKGFAEANLSEACRKRGEAYGTTLCYEEDCAFWLPVFELLNQKGEAFRAVLFAHCDETTDCGTLEGAKKAALESLSSWNADYLLEVGVTPEPTCYAYYLERKEDRRLRDTKSPDLIVAASGDWHNECKKGEVLVTTADGLEHFVTEDSYHARRDRGGLNLLSKCTLSRTEAQAVLAI